MAISKKEAKIVLSTMLTNISKPQLQHMLDDLRESPVKNKSFRKSIKRIAKMLEQPKKAAAKKAA